MILRWIERTVARDMTDLKSKTRVLSSIVVLGGAMLGAASYLSVQTVLPDSILPMVIAVALAACIPAFLLRRDPPALQTDLAALNLLPDEVWLIDKVSEKVCYFNSAAAARVGLDRQANRSLHLDHIMPLDQKDALRCALAAVDSAAVSDLQGAGRSLRATTVQMPDGETVMLVLRDVTRDLAEEKTKTDFISTVSHELRSPLTSIKGSMGLLLSNAAGELPKPACSLLEIAHRNAERLVLILNDILDLQKMVEGRMDIDVQDVDAAELIHEALAASSLFLQRFDLDIKVVGADQPVMMRSDPNRILQVLGNLLTNAAKFSKRHGTVIVSLTQTAGAVTMQVRDQGVGIPRNEQSKVFERFADMTNSQRQKKGGSGLGLSICKAIVDNLGGIIGFESTEGVGTAFHLTLPRGIAVDPQSVVADELRDAC